MLFLLLIKKKAKNKLYVYEYFLLFWLQTLLCQAVAPPAGEDELPNKSQL